MFGLHGQIQYNERKKRERANGTWHTESGWEMCTPSPLPDGTFAFCRVLKGAAAAFYRHRGESPSDLPPDEEYEFVVCVYDHAFRPWQFVAARPFAAEEEAWPPPFCWVDQITRKGSLYIKGERVPCSYEECRNLEILAVWDGCHLTDRLMGDHKWENCFKKPLFSEKEP